MNLLENESFKTIVAIIGVLTPIISLILKYDFRQFYRKTKYPKRVNQLEAIIEKTEDKRLKKQAKTILKEYQFSIVANCEYSISNKKLFNYSIKTRKTLVWNKVKSIRKYIDLVDSELKINYRGKIGYWIEFALSIFLLFITMVSALFVFCYNNTIYGIFIFAIIALLSLIPATLVSKLIEKRILLKRIINKVDLQRV